MAGILALTGTICIPAAAQERCSLPAYAHNDYENRRPLLDALGRVLRVYDVPLKPAVYRSLREVGVDFLGIKDLARGRAILSGGEH